MRSYITESEMGFLRRNGVFSSTAIKSGLLIKLLFWYITTDNCTDLFICSDFSEKLVRFRVRGIETRSAVIRGEVLGESWLPAL